MARKPQPLKSIPSLALIGAGKMGGAMLDGWLARGLNVRNVTVIEPQPAKAVKALARRGLKLNPKPGAKGKIAPAAVVVIAVKPQTAAEALPAIAAYVGERTLVISIMAGRTLAFLQKAFPQAAVVRAMPNTPASIGRGITVAVPNSKVTRPQRARAHGLLAATGAVEWIGDESLMDAVTAVSGSGPAYVFLLTETLARAGVAAGLPKTLADNLARATVAGSGELLHRAMADPEILRKNVTSRGGTTAAALDVLMAADGLDPLMRKAIAAATRRGRELAG